MFTLHRCHTAKRNTKVNLEKKNSNSVTKDPSWVIVRQNESRVEQNKKEKTELIRNQMILQKVS